MTRNLLRAVRLMYYVSTGDPAPAGDIAAALAELPNRARRAIELRATDHTWRQVGQKLHVTAGAAQSLVRRAFNRANKRMLDLPRYHQIGHPPPNMSPSIPKTPHAPQAAVTAAQVPKVTRTLAHALDPPPRDARGRILRRTAGALRTVPEIKPPHPLPY